MNLTAAHQYLWNLICFASVLVSSDNYFCFNIFARVFSVYVGNISCRSLGS